MSKRRVLFLSPTNTAPKKRTRRRRNLLAALSSLKMASNRLLLVESSVWFSSASFAEMLDSIDATISESNFDSEEKSVELFAEDHSGDGGGDDAAVVGVTSSVVRRCFVSLIK